MFVVHPSLTEREIELTCAALADVSGQAMAAHYG